MYRCRCASPVLAWRAPWTASWRGSTAWRAGGAGVGGGGVRVGQGAGLVQSASCHRYVHADDANSLAVCKNQVAQECRLFGESGWVAPSYWCWRRHPLLMHLLSNARLPSMSAHPGMPPPLTPPYPHTPPAPPPPRPGHVGLSAARSTRTVQQMHKQASAYGTGKPLDPRALRGESLLVPTRTCVQGGGMSSPLVSPKALQRQPPLPLPPSSSLALTPSHPTPPLPPASAAPLPSLAPRC